MRRRIQNKFLLAALLSGLGLIFAEQASAQVFTSLHSFTTGDEANPDSGLVVSGGTLYGTTQYGSSSGNGTVFALNINGSGFTNLHSFNGSDGFNPFASLIFSGDTLYGTAPGGGSSDKGAIFAIHTERHRVHEPV